MSEINVSDYSIFEKAIVTTANMGTCFANNTSVFNSCKTKLGNQEIFMGPICDECVSAMDVVDVKIAAERESYETLKNHLGTTMKEYMIADNKADITITDPNLKSVSDLGIKTESTADKDINADSVKDGTNVAKALNKYGDELNNAKYATVKENIYTTTTEETINGKRVLVTHVVVNNPSQVNGAPANGAYGNGYETPSAAAGRLGATILVNGSHYTDGGREDLKGANNIVIVNGEIKTDGYSGGQEMLLDSNGNIYNASGKSASQLVNDGVKYSYSCHSTQVIVNGDTSPAYNEPRSYHRTVVGQSGPCEYYIVTDIDDQQLSGTADYLKNKGVNNAYSLDQGGSVTLVRNTDVINNPSDGSERAVGDFLYFTN